MNFNSYIFILLFLPVFVISYYSLSHIKPWLSKVVIIAGSLVFYCYGGIKFAAFLLASVLLNYLFAYLIAKTSNKKAMLILAVIINVFALLFFKCRNFFIDNVNLIFSKDIVLKDLIMPLGISFITFRQIMYAVNVYKDEIKADIIDYLSYILYFPVLLMGPLNEHKDYIDRINDNESKKVNWDNIACGIKTFSFGLFKKVVIADTFAVAVNWAFLSIFDVTAMEWMLVMLFYTFEIYFDFSGYTDMAMGVSCMLNIDLPVNFDSPYKAFSINEFWKRWHASLTAFFTKYIYIPLGGSRKGLVRTCINIMIVFLASGLWHGANWTFILWGVLHGLFSVFDRLIIKHRDKVNPVVQWMLTFLVVNVLWLLFRSESISQWKSILGIISRFENTTVSYTLLNFFNLPELNLAAGVLHLSGIIDRIRGFNMLMFILLSFGICMIPENNYKNLKKNNWGYLVLSVITFLWGFLCLSSESVFVYFNF